MPLTHHDDLEFIAGDDWTIDGVLLDVNGSPLDLNGAFFQWTLIDPTGLSVADLLGATTVNIVQPAANGQVQIIVSKQVTTSLLAGRFHDALRVSIDYTTTFWMGTILVGGNPFDLIPSFMPDDTVFNSLGLAAGAAVFGTPPFTAS